MDILNHEYHFGATPFDPNAVTNNDYEKLPEGSVDKIIGFINDKYNGGSVPQSGLMGPGAVDGSQFIASTESGGDKDGGAEDKGGGEQSE